MMSPVSIRDRKARATRMRIAEAALDLFSSQGFSETTIVQIAAEAGVGRRTVFRHFATKEAILFDHLVVRRDNTVRLLQARPLDEPLLVSLHAVLRELCVHGYDRRLLTQIRDVIAANPRLARAELVSGRREFEKHIYEAVEKRAGKRWSLLQIRALVYMAFSWFEVASGNYLMQSDRSLVECFDEAVGLCLESAAGDLAPSLDESGAPRLRAKRGAA